MTNKLLLILFLIASFVGNAQIPKQAVAVDLNVFPQEKVDLVINSDILMAGELLEYKGFVLSTLNKPSELSKVFYVSMRNEEDSIIFHHKLKVEKGTANGDFFIPSNLKTGNYRLIGYTNFTRNNTQHAFIQKDLYVINTFIKTIVNSKSTDTLSIKSLPNNGLELLSNQNNSGVIKISTDEKKYGYRKKVSLNIENSLGQLEGNFALSVRKVNPIEISGKPSNLNKIHSPENFYIPELRGELISGVVLSKTDNNPVANKIVSLTIPGKEDIFKLAKTNALGRFFFSVSEEYDADESIVQLNETEKDASNFTLTLDDKALNLQKNNPMFLKLDSNIKDWLEERSVQLQIENAYFDAKKDSVLDSKISPAFYDNLGKLFLLDDYTRFPTVRETFIEVVTPAAIRGTGEETRFLVYNSYDPNRLAKFNDLPPLVLMDGMMVQNNSDVVNYNAREIKSIRVISQPYRYGPKIYSGIIAFETKAGNFVPSLSKGYIEKVGLPSAVKKKQIYRPDYSVKNSLSRIPDYRVQLFWEPNLDLLHQGYSTSFYTSDVSGIFEISLEGYDREGKYILSKNYFSVEEK